MKIIKVSFIIISFLFISCIKDDNSVNPEDSTGVIMPLEVGNEWIYIDSTFSESGSLEKVDTSKLAITSKTIINYNGKNIEVFIFESDQTKNVKTFLRNEIDGLYIYGGRYFDKDFLLGKSLLCKYPVNVGDIWEQKIYDYNIRDSTFFIWDTLLTTCISINQKLNTSRGELECYVYNYQQNFGNEIYDISYYFVRNQGYVGAINRINGILRFKKTLKTYVVLKFIDQ